MRRFVGFALVGVIATFLVSFLPAAASTASIAIVVGVGAAAGSVAREDFDIVALALGALVGAVAGGAIHGLGSGEAGIWEVVSASATIAIVVAIAGSIARIVGRARRSQPPPRSGR